MPERSSSLLWTRMVSIRSTPLTSVTSGTSPREPPTLFRGWRMRTNFSWSLTTVISTLLGKSVVLSTQPRISTHLSRTTFNVDDWISHTPKSVLAKNFGLNESVFDSVPSPNPYIFNSTVSTRNVTGPEGALVGNSSYVYHTFQHPSEPVPGQGGELWIIDSRNFPIATTIAATFVKLEPRGLRELHWHPNVRHPKFRVR